MSQDAFIIRRVMDRLLGRLPVTKKTRLFSSKEKAELARDGEIVEAVRNTFGRADLTQVRKYSGGCWGYDEE